MKKDTEDCCERRPVTLDAKPAERFSRRDLLRQIDERLPAMPNARALAPFVIYPDQNGRGDADASEHVALFESAVDKLTIPPNLQPDQLSTTGRRRFYEQLKRLPVGSIGHVLPRMLDILKTDPTAANSVDVLAILTELNQPRADFLAAMQQDWTSVQQVPWLSELEMAGVCVSITDPTSNWSHLHQRIIEESGNE